jgi:hypothetical protein
MNNDTDTDTVAAASAAPTESKASTLVLGMSKGFIIAQSHQANP